MSAGRPAQPVKPAAQPVKKVYTSKFIVALEAFREKALTEAKEAEQELRAGSLQAEGIQIVRSMSEFAAREEQKRKADEEKAIELIEQKAKQDREKLGANPDPNGLLRIETKKAEDIKAKQSNLKSGVKSRIEAFSQEVNEKYPDRLKRLKKVDHYTKSEACISEVHNRFFKFDPKTYHRIFDRIPVVMDADIFKKWCEEYFKILSNVKLGEMADSGQRKISREDEQKLNAWTKTIIDSALQSLFDSDSKGLGMTFQQELLEYFGWKSDAKYSEQKIEQTLQQNIFSILHAYLEVAYSMMGDVLQYDFVSGPKPKAKAYLINNEFEYDALPALLAACRFPERIRWFFCERVQNDPIEFAAREFFLKLSKSPTSEQFCQQLANCVENDVKDLANDTNRVNKIKFWLQVISKCIDENEEGKLDRFIEILWGKFSNYCKENDKIFSKDGALKAQYNLCGIQSVPDAVEDVSRDTPPAAPAQLPDQKLQDNFLNRWLDLRDNLLLVQEIGILSKTAAYTLEHESKEITAGIKAVDKDEFSKIIINYFLEFTEESLFDKNRKNILDEVVKKAAEKAAAIIVGDTEKGDRHDKAVNLSNSTRINIVALNFLKKAAEALLLSLQPRRLNPAQQPIPSASPGVPPATSQSSGLGVNRAR